jgi:VanZ family protein
MKAIAAAAVALFFALSALATSPLGSSWFAFVNRVPGGDKTGHFLAVGLVAFVVVLGFAPIRFRGRRVGAGCWLVLIAVVVTLEEYSQQLFPNRRFSLLDLVYSYAGLMAFGGAAAWIDFVRSGRET